ncbi:MAG: alpha/beta hydrolase-fold protein [Verrucomicrobiota bacterium]
MSVTFTTRWDTVIGQDVFVLGSIPQLGNWARNQAIRMSASNLNNTATSDWKVTVAIPPGTSYEYKFVKRYNCSCCWDSPNISCYGRTDDASVTYESGANRTGTTAPLVPAPYPGKTIFYYSGWPNVSLYYSNNVTGWTNRAMYATGPGRSVGEKIWRVDNVDKAGSTNVQFGFFTVTGNVTNYDNAGRPGLDYQSPLDACVVQDGQVYNYWPPGFVSTNRVETYFITPSNGLQSRWVRIYLPRGYNENTGKRYPVLYMQDGQNIFLGAGPSGGWNTDTNVNNLIRFGKMRETIVVGVDNGDRQCEYTPCSLGSTICPSGATADKYAAFLINDVKAYIDSTYRTLTDADNTGVMGSSRGGLISVYLAWEYSSVFHKVAVLSPSFWACATTKDNLALAPKRPLRIYLDSGTVGDFPTTIPTCNPCYDGIAQTMTARDNLIKNGYVFNDDLDHTFGFGDDHNEYYWTRRSPRAYTFLFPTRDEPNTVLDATAPPRITNFQLAGPSSSVTWTSYRLRTYGLEGSTNEQFSSSMTWSNLVTLPPESLPWSYPTVVTTNGFRFFRVREDAVPNWPN